MFYRYSDNTIETLEMLDDDDKIDLELILALIRHIVLKEEVSDVCQMTLVGFLQLSLRWKARSVCITDACHSHWISIHGLDEFQTFRW